MPFNLLVLTILNRQTKLSGSGNVLSMEPREDEESLFFEIDSDASPINRLIKQTGDKKICDGLILYLRGNKRIICLTELKGRDINHAAEQILNTYGLVRKLLQNSLRQTKEGIALFRDTEWRAYILQNRKSSAPTKKSNKSKSKKANDALNDLRKCFAKVKVSKNKDIGEFLRER